MAGSLSSFQQVAAELPFSIDNFEQASHVFQRWREHGQPDDERLVELWTYCYVRRYFMIKFAKADAQPADFDELVSTAYKKVEAARSNLEDPSRYAAWVSVVCKNTFLNYVRREREYVSVNEDEEKAPVLYAEERRETGSDSARALQAVHASISQLPDYLVQAARLRLLEDKSYEEISAATGKSKASMRTYVNRARKKLRQNPALRIFWNSPDTPS